MSPLGLVLVVILVLVLLGGLGGERWGVPYGYGGGHYGVGLVGVLLIIIIVLLLTGRLG
jgi:uncharacterized membrane protein